MVFPRGQTGERISIFGHTSRSPARDRQRGLRDLIYNKKTRGYVHSSCAVTPKSDTDFTYLLTELGTREAFAFKSRTRCAFVSSNDTQPWTWPSSLLPSRRALTLSFIEVTSGGSGMSVRFLFIYVSTYMYILTYTPQVSVSQLHVSGKQGL